MSFNVFLTVIKHYFHCVIWGIHSIVDEDYNLLGYDAMLIDTLIPTF
jgi:hypothetical protein